MDTSTSMLLGVDAAPASFDAFASAADVLDCVDVTGDALPLLEVPLPPPQSPLPSPLSSSSSSYSSSLTEPEPRPPRRKRRNSTRDRENSERASLRRQIQQLEALVLQLERGHAPSAADSVARKRLAATWERLAERQLAARRFAEATRAELVQRTQQNADWIRRLRALLAERRHNSQRMDHAATGRRRGVSRRDAAIFETLKQELRKACMRADHMLAFSRVPSRGGVCGYDIDSSHRWSQVRSDHSGSTIACTILLPFDTSSVATAAWNVLACVRQTSPTAFHRVRVGSSPMTLVMDACVSEVTEDSCALKFQARMEDDLPTEVVSYRAVMQRLAWEGAVDVSDTKTDATESADGHVVLISRSVMLADNGESVGLSDMLYVAVSRDALGASVLSMVLESQVRRDLESFRPSASHLSESCVKGLMLEVESSLLVDAPSTSKMTGAARIGVQTATV